MEGREKQIRTLVMQDVWDWYEPIRTDLKLLLFTIDTLREENKRMREALEKIACARDPFNGLALVMSDVAITALAQAARKEGE